jgi:uncharacterized protein (DUF3084 family)
MSISAVAATTSGTAPTAQSPAQRVATLQAKAADLDTQIAATKSNKKLTCSEIDSKVGTLETQKQQIEQQIARVQAQQQQSENAPATGGIHVIA